MWCQFLKLLDVKSGIWQKVNALGLFELIMVVILLFFLGIGGMYIYKSLAGPKKFEEIEQLLEQGRYEACIGELEKLLELDERDLRARFLLAQVYWKMKNWGSASIELRQCIKLATYTNEVTEVQVRRYLARSLKEAGNYTDAKNEFLILTTLEPDNYENYFEVGKLFFNSGEATKAAKFLSKSASLNERHSETLSYLGQAHYHLASYQEARDILTRAIQIDPNLHRAHYYLGLCLRYVQDFEWALKEFEKAERDNSLKPKAILGKGMVLIDQEAYPRAVSELERGLKYVAKGSEAELNLCYLIAHSSEKIRDMHTAIKNWEYIDRINPKFRDVKEKLSQYSDLRMDDSIKDFMIANNEVFGSICKKIVTGMGQNIVNFNALNDSEVQILAMEEDDGKRNYKRQQMLLWINRDSLNVISENQVREFLNKMKSQNASRGLIMTTGEVSNSAVEFSQSRPIEIADTTKIATYLKNAVDLGSDQSIGV